ncbi:MAG: hypothetical protein H6711_03270 [Myxococcales bacterium]|nr:hypothetical protein [Myxococcales bacterium]
MSMIAALTFALALQPSATDQDADARARVSTQTPAGVTAVYDFENDNVDGEVMRPEGVDLSGRKGPRFSSLLTIRGTFVAEMIRLANDV